MALKFYRKDSNVFDSDTTMVTRSGTSRSKLVILFLVLLLGAGLIFAGIRFLSLNNGMTIPGLADLTPTPFITEVPEAVTPTPEESITPTGSTTPSPTGKTSPTPSTTASVTLEILNGSGASGVAGTAASALKKLGYTISGTGNADEFTYEGYTIRIKKSQSSKLSQLRKDVATLGSVTEALTTLPESSDVDAQVIVGK